MSYASEVLADSPRTFLRLDEAAGSITFADATGNGFAGNGEGTYTAGAAPLIEGGAAVAFAGNGDITTPTTALADGAAHSFECWVKTAGAGSGARLLVGDTTGLAGSSSSFLWVNNNILTFRVYNTSSAFVDAVGPAIGDDTPHHVVGTFEAGVARLYLDGALVATSGALSGAARGAKLGTVARTGSNSWALTGTLDEVAFYPSALSAARVAAHRAAGLPGAPSMGLAGTQQRETAAFTLAPIVAASLTGVEQREVGAFGVAVDIAPEITLAGVQQRETGAFSAVAPPPSATTVRNRVGGRRRTGLGVVDYSPPVVEPPTPITAHVREVAQAFGGVTIDGTQPRFAVTEASVVRDRDRIVVGGKDVTYFRDVPTPTPDFSLIQPLRYGSGSIAFPQIAANFERPGAGALRWLRKGSPVKVQRVRDGVVVATDYKGFVADWTVSGGSLTVQLGGEASGRAAMVNKQIPLVVRTWDVGRHAYGAVSDLGLPFRPFLGPETGIRFERLGGTSLLEYVNELCARAVKRSGEQYTVDPGQDGIYRLSVKDRTTIDATVYFDDARLKPDLRSDMAEEPNRVFVTGTTPEGRKVKFGHYPGLRQGTPPDWPLAPSATFGVGAEGDHVHVLKWSLNVFGYLKVVDLPGGYDADVTRAVRDLQDDAGLPATGNVDRATWRALFDLDVTGYSLIQTKVHPAAQSPKVRKWNYTPSGAISSRNDRYDPTRLKVDLNVNMGTGFTRQQMREWAKVEIEQGASDNWVGTLDLNMAPIRGEHTPGAPVAEADVMQPRELRPGMNLWAPQFMGGTLFHISGVEVGDGGRSVRVSLDTRARDTMKVWEVIARNRESRKNPARAWINQYRSSGIDKDAIITFDEMGGVIREGVDLTAGQWTTFPVVAGQEGTIAQLRIALSEPQEFACAVFGRQVEAKWLNMVIPAPLAKTRNDIDGTGEPWYEVRGKRERLKNKIVLYAAGTHDEPCGLDVARKVDGNGNATGAQATGVHSDDASFAYRTFREPVLTVAVWVPYACKVKPGRIMWNQLEEGS